jgi:hypothetical protein
VSEKSRLKASSRSIKRWKKGWKEKWPALIRYSPIRYSPIRYSPIRPFAHLLMGDGHVGHLHQLIAGLQHRLLFARQRVLGPDFAYGKGAPPPAAFDLLRLAPDAALLQFPDGQDDVGEQLQRLGVEGQPELEPFAGVIAKDPSSVRSLNRVAAARQRGLDGVRPGHVAAAAALRLKGTDQGGHRAGGDQRTGGTFAGLPVHAETVSQRMEQAASDGAALVLVQFDSALCFGDDAQTMGAKVLHSILRSDRMMICDSLDCVLKWVYLPFDPFGHTETPGQGRKNEQGPNGPSASHCA